MLTMITLTVAESKRLIAKGVRAIDYVDRALEEGIVAAGAVARAVVSWKLEVHSRQQGGWSSWRLVYIASESFAHVGLLPAARRQHNWDMRYYL